MDKLRVVCYEKDINGNVGATTTIFVGNYDSCLKFYMENKDNYRKKNKYLELMC